VVGEGSLCVAEDLLAAGGRAGKPQLRTWSVEVWGDGPEQQSKGAVRHFRSRGDTQAEAPIPRHNIMWNNPPEEVENLEKIPQKNLIHDLPSRMNAVKQVTRNTFLPFVTLSARMWPCLRVPCRPTCCTIGE